MKHKNAILLLLLIVTQIAYAQFEPFKLTNPSFEDTPGATTVPSGWIDSGSPNETSPDTHPAGIFGVTKRPKDGDSYIGLVTRENDSYESVAQRLVVPLEKGTCYEFSLYLAKSKVYFSSDNNQEKELLAEEPITNNKLEVKNYNKGVVLRIWGGTSYVIKKEKLAESSVVNHPDWQLYKFKLQPQNKATVIFIEAYYKTPALFPYGGNILIDNISEIIPLDCSTDTPLENEPLANLDKPKEEKNQVSPKEEKIITIRNPTRKPKKNSRYRAIRNGKTVNIDNLVFDADAYEIKMESFTSLNEIYDFLQENDDLVVEIGGHTNSIPSNETCNRLSKSRAKSVADYLIQKGIVAKRIKYKGYGKHKPRFSNKTSQGRKGNQRVEIKVIRTEKR